MNAVETTKLATFSFNSDSYVVMSSTIEFQTIVPGCIPGKCTLGDLFHITRENHELLQSSLPLSFMLNTHLKAAPDEKFIFSIQRVLNGLPNECHCTVLPRQSPVSEKDIISLLEDSKGTGTLFQKTFLDCPMGILIVDEATYLVDANNFMFRIFGIEKKDIRGTKFGNIFRCSAAEKKEHLCGTFENCRTCSLRNAITYVLNTGNPISHVELEHEFSLNGRSDTMWFLINAVPITYGDSRFVIVSFADITKRKSLEENLRKLGITDELTSLYNRRFIIDQLEKLSFDNNLADSPLSIVLLDIDNFKYVNDNFGHLVGDEVLKTLSSILSSAIRHSDYAGRYGGEEFLLLLPKTTRQGAGILIERILKVLSATRIESIDYPITFSAGIVELYKPVDDISEVLDAADKLLYQRKADGKNGYYSCLLD